MLKKGGFSEVADWFDFEGTVMHGIRLTAMCAGWIVLVVGMVTRSPAIEPSTANLRAFQGGWVLSHAERDGQAIAPSAAANLGLVVRGNRYTIAPGSQPSMTGKFTVNPGKWPQQIDFTPISGQYAGQTFRGIYTSAGDAHQVSFAPPGQPRPTSFNTAGSRGQVTYVWKRLRALPPPVRATPPGDAQLFQHDVW